MPPFPSRAAIGLLLLWAAISPALAASVANTPTGNAPTPLPLISKGQQQTTPVPADRAAASPGGVSLGALALPPATQFVPCARTWRHTGC
jgi:hypothetical protein